MERKKAIVTGASRGIGKGIATALAREGYDLAISYATKAQEAEALASQLADAFGGRCFPLQAALDTPGAATAFFGQAVASLGGLDLLVNNARRYRVLKAYSTFKRKPCVTCAIWILKPT